MVGRDHAMNIGTIVGTCLGQNEKERQRCLLDKEKEVANVFSLRDSQFFAGRWWFRMMRR